MSSTCHPRSFMSLPHILLYAHLKSVSNSSSCFLLCFWKTCTQVLVCAKSTSCPSTWLATMPLPSRLTQPKPTLGTCLLPSVLQVQWHCLPQHALQWTVCFPPRLISEERSRYPLCFHSVPGLFFTLLQNPWVFEVQAIRLCHPLFAWLSVAVLPIQSFLLIHWWLALGSLPCSLALLLPFTSTLTSV